MKDVFLLDADETLLDFRRSEREQLTETLARRAVLADGRIVQRFHEINDALWKALERGETTRARLVIERFEILFSELGVQADAADVARDYFAGLRERAYLLPGAGEFLASLKAHGRVYIVTNGSREIQRSRLGKTGILAAADGVFISEEAGADKPSPEFAHYAIAGIEGFTPARAVWIGDSLTSDMLCARAAGIDFILYAPGGAPADYTGACARSYEEALSLLRLPASKEAGERGTEG